MRVLSCDSPYGQGGVGQHFAQLVEESREQGELDCYFSIESKPDDDKGISLPRPRWQELIARYVLRKPGWRSYFLSECLDRRVAARLEEPSSRFMGMVGKSLHSFRKARQIGFSVLELVAVNSHVENLKRLHDRAAQVTGISDSWLHSLLVSKTLKEYEEADAIYVHSEYTRQSFVDAGIPESKLTRMHLDIDPRFEPPATRPRDDTFRVVYVGRLDATKGIPLLRKAFDRLPMDQKELTLVGGWSTRVMRKYLKPWIEEHDNIYLAPGDPLPALHQADVFVHPTFEDGFGYAPMEALATGVPVIVTEDTGMKEHVEDGLNGYIVPTGDAGAIFECMLKIYHDPLTQPRDLTGAAEISSQRSSQP